MSPVPYNISGKGGGPWVWRSLVLAAVLVASAALALSTNLFGINANAIDATTALSCRIGAFLVGVPTTKLPGESHQQFHHGVVKEIAFLNALKAADCSAVKGARVTEAGISKQLRALRRIVPGSTKTPSPPQGAHHPASSRLRGSEPSTASVPSTTGTTPNTGGGGGGIVGGGSPPPSSGGGGTPPPPSGGGGGPPPRPPAPPPSGGIGGGVRQILHGVQGGTCSITGSLGLPLCSPAP